MPALILILVTVGLILFKLLINWLITNRYIEKRLDLLYILPLPFQQLSQSILLGDKGTSVS